MIMTGTTSIWNKFFSLRCSLCGATGVHPQADELATLIYNQLHYGTTT